MKFSELPLSNAVHKGIETLGFDEPTPVQAEAIPPAMKGKDIRACAQTGTGKTCAFVIPLLHKLTSHPNSHRPNSLILVPTRELGSQVYSVLQEVGKTCKIKTVLIMGGMDMKRQVIQIKSGAQVLVATPGRLLDHVRRHTLSLKKIDTLILDEADRMLDMGFLPDIKRILAQCPPKKQTMLFSATFPTEIDQLVNQFLHHPHVVDLAPSQPAANITQIIYPISRTQKEAFIKVLLERETYSSALVFCRTKHGADHLARALKKEGKKVAVIHSNFTQAQRDKALKDFKHKVVQILVATDIAARGLDIKDISHVINFDVPQNPEDYIHRIGRTGRAEATGDAVTLMAPDEEVYVGRIERLIEKFITREKLDDFPYLVPPRLTPKTKSVAESFGKIRRRIPSSSSARFRRR